MPFDSGLRLTKEQVEDMEASSGIMDTLISRMMKKPDKVE